MKENENRQPAVRVTEGNPPQTADVKENTTQNKIAKLKTPLVFGLMAIVFGGCMYLIFKPSPGKKKTGNIGLNDAVPEATGAGMPADKGKAYDLEILDRKEQEKRNALTTLSDYWNTEDKKDQVPEAGENVAYGKKPAKSNNPALASYQEAQNTMGSFYRKDNPGTTELRRQLEELKERVSENEQPKTATVHEQLALMEKSYQMAAKYFPQGGSNHKEESPPKPVNTVQASAAPVAKQHFTAFIPAEKNTVSALYREPTDSAFLADWDANKNRALYTSGPPKDAPKPNNSVKACVLETQTIVGEAGVKLLLLEPAKISSHILPKGTAIIANAQFQGGRLQLKISSIALGGNIIPVDITIYDLDGQQGLYVPYSPEMNALSEMACNMSQTGGTSVMLTQSAGQQVAADLSRSVVQGISGYFAKKVRTPKVTLKTGHQVFLVSKQ